MWIYVFNDDERKAWSGTIALDVSPKSRWKFELVRHAEPRDMYSAEPFGSASVVPALLDYQQRCTIIRPIVLKTDPGTVGVGFEAMRTLISGSFQALLRGLFVESEDVPVFKGLVFDSRAYALWYGRRPFKREFNSDTRSYDFEVHKPEQETLHIPGLGEVSSTSDAAVALVGDNSEIKSRAYLNIRLQENLSLKRVMELAMGLELLFGFLVGFRPKPPVFTLVSSDTERLDDTEIAATGKLEFSGLEWLEREAPHPMERISMRGRDGVDLRTVLEHFLAAETDFVTRIHVVEYGRFFSRNLNDRFAVLMPVLEDYLGRTYPHQEETGYLEARDKFFAHVEQAQDPDIQNFARKHLKEIDSKAPSLKTLLKRAIDSLNADGFRFSPVLAKRIQTRRARLFHSPDVLGGSDANLFYQEVRAATAILMLHTLRDLGVPISSLAQDVWALRDLAGFLQPTERTEPQS